MLYVLLIIAAIIILLWAKETKKAVQDPDVKEASELGILIFRYRKYQEAWDRIQAIYNAYGTDNPKAIKMANEIIEKLPNLNEWRRFSEKQCQKRN